MNNTILSALLSLMIPTAALAAVQSGNVYVRLYENRIEQAKILVQQREQSLKFQQISMVRQEYLYAQRATSAQTLEREQSLTKTAVLLVDDARAQLQEAMTLRDIAVERTALGLEMPICPGSPIVR